MREFTAGDVAHLRFAATRTQPIASRKWHEGVVLAGYLPEEDLVILKGDGHYFAIERWLIEEIVRDSVPF